jgi:hypothetical protein
VIYTFNDEAVGGTFNYNKLEGKIFSYHPLGRYQDEFAGVAELEGLWNIVSRWTLVGFGGAGHTDGDIPVVSEAQTIWAGGDGFRYLLARRLGLKAGIDLAWSEGTFAFYLAIGTGWRQ